MKKHDTLTKWYQELWLPTAAAVYLLICLFDFIVMPVYTAYDNSRLQNTIIAKLNTQEIGNFADGVTKSIASNHQWNPLTLLGGGMFHLAFGSLLTGGAVTRGFAKKSEVEGYYKTISGNTPDTRRGTIADSDDPSIPKA